LVTPVKDNVRLLGRSRGLQMEEMLMNNAQQNLAIAFPRDELDAR
jgi:hypothetical protein